jgi:hypothetical protein
LVERENIGYRGRWTRWNTKNNILMTKKAILLTVLGIAVGAIAGYVYYAEIGCISGTCSITSKPVNSTLYGGFMGGLLFNTFVKSPKK